MRAPRRSDLDLNLLVTLDALLAERNARRAAARLGVTPSAVSHALRRLREVLGDPLFVRTPRGLVPTRRAEALTQTLERCLSELDAAVHGETTFDAATARRAFTLEMADAAEMVLLPPLLRHLAEHAPGIDLVVRPPTERTLEALESGALDLAIGVFPEAPAAFRRKTLYAQSFVCLLRKGHPAAKGALTLERYLALSHVAVAPVGTSRSAVDDALAKRGRARRIALTVPHFLVAPAVVAETDLALLLPERIGRTFAASFDLHVLAPPLEVEGFTVSQLWHERAHHDPAHAWLRAALVTAARDSGRRPARSKVV